MNLTDYILKWIPQYSSDDSGLESKHLDIIGSHLKAEIPFLIAQRPAPAPTVVSPKTPIGTNKETILVLIDNDFTAYNSTIPDEESYRRYTFNPWRETRFISSYLLTGLIDCFEQNEIALISYYNAPNASPPPAGYPTTPIPKPISIPAPSTIPLTISGCATYIRSVVSAGLANTNPPAVLTSEVDNFLNALGDFIVNEVFVP